ncbi:MAG: Maf family protein [Thermoplasmatota archaeon]
MTHVGPPRKVAAPAGSALGQDRDGGRDMILLASGSRRRQDLLRSIGIAFEVVISGVEEPTGLAPGATADAAARAKAAAVARDHAGRWVIAADTIVDLDGRAVGKPLDATEAASILASLAGRSHIVRTVVAVADPKEIVRTVSCATTVEFGPLDAARIAAYVATGEPLGKAGAYAIQGYAAAFVRRIEGSWSNVVGLPLFETVALLESCRFPLPPFFGPQRP